MDPKKAEMQIFKEAVCEDVADVYSRKSRDVIGRVAGRYLQSERITPSELLHSSRHQRAFSDAGTTLMQAVQKVAIAQANGTPIPVSERVRRLYEITDQLHREALKSSTKGRRRNFRKALYRFRHHATRGRSSDQAFQFARH